MRVKCLAQEHNTMSPARARTQTTRSRVERTNHEATAPPEEMCFSERKLKKACKHIKHINVSSIVWTLIDNSKLANQIARLVAIVVN